MDDLDMGDTARLYHGEYIDEITTLRARLAEVEAAQIMLKAERDGLASLLLSVQQDSIAATKALATARRDARIADISVEAMAEIKATIDGESTQTIDRIVYGALEEIRALAGEAET